MRPQRQASLLDRGRSRDVSPVALARRASEERRISQRRAAIRALHVLEGSAAFSHTSRPTSTPSPPSGPLSVPDFTTSPEPITPCTPPRLLPSSSTKPKQMSGLSLSLTACHSSDDIGIAVAVPSPDSHPQPICAPSTLALSRSYVRDLSAESDNCPLPPLSLQDQMQEAYAAENMLAARIIFLRIQGIEVTSNDDPRIAQVRDEDFIFVPGGELVLDDESLAALREAEAKVKARREQDDHSRKWRERELAWEAEAERVRAAKALAHRMREESMSNLHAQRLEFRGKGRSQPRGRLHRANPFGRTVSRVDTSTSPLSSSSSSSDVRHATGLSSSLPTSRPKLARASTTSVSFKEVVHSLQGPLFPVGDPSEDRCIRPRSDSQEKLLDVLLQAVEWEVDERRRVKGKYRQLDGTGSRLRHSAVTNLACAACSAGTASTISRTNSWASSDSDASLSTNITSPPNSPSFEKSQLPSLIDDIVFRRGIVHSCRPRRESRTDLTSVALARSPLLYDGTQEVGQIADAGRGSERERRRANGKTALITRVKRSVSTVFEIANRIQLSYMRTVQFAVPLPLTSDAYFGHSQGHAVRRLSKRFSPKPLGYGANVSDVQKFAPRPARSPLRELNFPSEYNIPLAESNPDPANVPAQRIFTPIAFVTPSPLRPRYMPLSPEWRLRPVANPVTLRLKALANSLYARGIPWEGRSHSGSLGCGRERLTGVAFEGLGGSRLVFEAS